MLKPAASRLFLFLNKNNLFIQLLMAGEGDKHTTYS